MNDALQSFYGDYVYERIQVVAVDYAHYAKDVAFLRNVLSGPCPVAVNVDLREADLSAADLTVLRERLKPVEAEEESSVVQTIERTDEELEREQNW